MSALVFKNGLAARKLVSDGGFISNEIPGCVESDEQAEKMGAT